MSKKEKSMGNSNGRITAPVGLQPDMYGVQGLIKTGTFYDVAEACRDAHGRINKWSLNKPMRVDTPAELTLAQKRAVHYGLSVSPYGAQGLYNEYNSGMLNAWKYLPPRPWTDYCRMTDWDGYNHEAEPFLRSGIPEGSSFQVSKVQGGKITFELKTPESRTGQLTVADFTGTAYDLSESRVGAVLFRGNPVSDTSLANPLGIMSGDLIAGTTNPTITLDLSDIAVEGAVTVVFGILYQTSGDTFMPLPIIDDDNYWKCVVNLTNRAILGVGFSFNQAGFVGVAANTPLQNIFNFQSSGSALKVDERGSLSLLVVLTVRSDSTTDYTINRNDQFLVGVTGGSLSSEWLIQSMRIATVDGAAFTENLAISPGQSAEVLLTCDTGAYVFPVNMTDGYYTLTLRDSRLSLSQDPLTTQGLYLNYYPY